MAKENNLDEEINQAYIDLLGEDYADADDCAEAYQGEFDSDEDFARYIAEELTPVDNSMAWPFNCIDWEWAAKELMNDYSEEEGYYFRNL
jgi:antirestriction protein